MLKALEDVIKRIYTWKTVYPFSVRCTNIRQVPEYDTQDADAYSIEVERVNEDGSTLVFTDVLYLPRIVRGSVKVKGRAKQGIYTALCNYKIRIGRDFFSWGSGFSGTQYISVNWQSQDKVVLKDQYRSDTGQRTICEFHFSNLIKYFNLWDDSLVVYFPPEDLRKAEAEKNNEFQNEIPEFIKECIVPYDSLLKLRLLGKNPNLGEKITAEEVKAFISIMERSTDLADTPTPIDYKYLDTYEALSEELGRGYNAATNYFVNGTPGYTIRWETSNKFHSNGKFYVTSLQRSISNFFSNKEGMMFSNVQETTDTNALSVAEQNSKIYFEKWASSKQGATYEKQRLNPQFFVGIVDPIFTADSKDINIKNELGRDAIIKDGQVYVRLLDKKFKEVIVPAYEYLMSATLSVDNIDYANKKIFPIDGTYSIYQYGEYTTTTDPAKIDYLRKEDGILTDSVAMIPFASRTQSMRSINC